jgi:hypothetical protein
VNEVGLQEVEWQRGDADYRSGSAIQSTGRGSDHSRGMEANQWPSKSIKWRATRRRGYHWFAVSKRQRVCKSIALLLGIVGELEVMQSSFNKIVRNTLGARQQVVANQDSPRRSGMWRPPADSVRRFKYQVRTDRLDEFRPTWCVDAECLSRFRIRDGVAVAFLL